MPLPREVGVVLFSWGVEARSRGAGIRVWGGVEVEEDDKDGEDFASSV